MNKIENMNREELIEFIEAAKRGEIKSNHIKVWYLENDILKLANPKGKYTETTPQQFLNKYTEKDIIITYKDIDYNKHPYLKDKRFIMVTNEDAAKSLELLILND